MPEEFAAVVDLERDIWGPGTTRSCRCRSCHRRQAWRHSRAPSRTIAWLDSVLAAGIKTASRVSGRTCSAWSTSSERRRRSGAEAPATRADAGDGARPHRVDLRPDAGVERTPNFAKLGVVVEEHEENVYGESTSPLHKGNPTDRFVAEWWVREPRVEERLRGAVPLASVLVVEPANRTRPAGEWLEPTSVDLSLEARRISVEIPTGFTEMLASAPDLALEWRMATRRLFTTFARAYRAVEFFLNREAGRVHTASQELTSPNSKFQILNSVAWSSDRRASHGVRGPGSRRSQSTAPTWRRGHRSPDRSCACRTTGCPALGLRRRTQSQHCPCRGDCRRAPTTPAKMDPRLAPARAGCRFRAAAASRVRSIRKLRPPRARPPVPRSRAGQHRGAPGERCGNPVVHRPHVVPAGGDRPKRWRARRVSAPRRHRWP